MLKWWYEYRYQRTKGHTGRHMHEHVGQTIVHEHPGGEEPHGHCEHPEDGSRAAGVKSTTPLADALAEVDKAAADNGYTDQGEARPHLSRALWHLAEAVRVSLAEFSESDVRTLAVTANGLGGGAAYLPHRERAVLDKALALYGLVPGLPA
jgi:hypothetical protein